MSDAERLIESLGLQPHPEGGYFRETFRDEPDASGRSRCTAIYFLLKHGEQSRWHRIDAAEIWHWYAGAPLALSTIEERQAQTIRLLGPNLDNNEHPQIVVPTGVWQSAHTLGAYTLAGCTVSPGFEFSCLEIAPDGFPSAD